MANVNVTANDSNLSSINHQFGKGRHQLKPLIRPFIILKCIELYLIAALAWSQNYLIMDESSLILLQTQDQYFIEMYILVY